MPYKSGDFLFGKYRIEEIIGKGAFAEMYRAVHLELNTPRALKVLRKDAPGLGSTEYGEYQDRFKLEAQLGAKLNHPSIIQVHDFERDGKDLILIMEHAAGGSLSKRIEQTRQSRDHMPLETALAIVQEVSEGLAKLHELDVVHRDLKPSNILFDEKGHAKVADFGLAQTPDDASMRSLLSNPPPHPGTPAYMSPEQKNSTDYLTSASDVYALGLVLFEMLTGRVYRSQRPGTKALNLREDIPAWLDELLSTMLSETLEERPWDGDEVLAKLRSGIQVEKEKLKAERFRLETETGQTFPLGSSKILIGRKDVKRDVVVDIDLAPLDPRKIVSRKHATIERQKGNWVLVDQKSQNGSWLNGHKLTAEEPYPLQEGDEIIFGRNGVILKFLTSR